MFPLLFPVLPPLAPRQWLQRGCPGRLAFAVSLTLLLSGAAASAGGEDGPMASAPLPPPLPAAPPATGLQQPQEAPSPTSQRVLPKSHALAESGIQAGNLHKPYSNTQRRDDSAHAARGQKRPSHRAASNGEHRETHTVPQVASAIALPPAPLPFPYGYFPGTPPAYGYAPGYPPPWPPGPMLPR
jgi:hypothetical protein